MGYLDSHFSFLIAVSCLPCHELDGRDLHMVLLLFGQSLPVGTDFCGYVQDEP